MRCFNGKCLFILIQVLQLLSSYQNQNCITTCVLIASCLRQFQVFCQTHTGSHANSSSTIHVLHLPPLGLGGIKGADMLASLAPPRHLSGEQLGWTLLVCMVRDFRRGNFEVSWRSPSEGRTASALYSFVDNRKQRDHGAVAIITVATSDWPSYSCSVSHQRHPRVTRGRLTTSSGRTTC